MKKDFNVIRFKAVTQSIAVQLYDLACDLLELQFPTENFDDFCDLVRSTAYRINTISNQSIDTLDELRNALDPHDYEQ